MALINAKKTKEELEKRLLMYAATNNLLVMIDHDPMKSTTGEVAFLIKIRNRVSGKTKLEQDWIDNGEDPEHLHKRLTLSNGKTFELMGWNSRAYSKKVLLEDITTRSKFPMSVRDFARWRKHLA